MSWLIRLQLVIGIGEPRTYRDISRWSDQTYIPECTSYLAARLWCDGMLNLRLVNFVIKSRIITPVTEAHVPAVSQSNIQADCSLYCSQSPQPVILAGQ